MRSSQTFGQKYRPEKNFERFSRQKYKEREAFGPEGASGEPLARQINPIKINWEVMINLEKEPAVSGVLRGPACSYFFTDKILT